VTYAFKVGATVYLAGSGVVADIAAQLIHYSPAADEGTGFVAAAASICDRSACWPAA
jgi:hypothetical protein